MLKQGKIKIAVIVISITAFLFILNVLLSNFIENKIRNQLNNTKSDKYNIVVENVDFKILHRSISFGNIFLSPKSITITDSLSQNIKYDSLEKIIISSIIIKDIRYFDYLFRKDIYIGELEINDLTFQKSNLKKIDTSPRKPINLDSIHIDRINSLKIDKFDLNNIQYTIIDSKTSADVFHHKPISLDLDGFQLKKVNEQLFKVMPINEQIKIFDIEFEIPNKGHKLLIGEVILNTKTSGIKINNLNYKTINGKYALAKKDIYNNVVPEISIENIELFNIDFDKIIQNKGVFIDSVLISNALFDLYKDRRKPFDKRLNKKLPHIVLKKMELPLYIKQINIENSLLLLEENFPNKNVKMELKINEIDAQIYNISSIKEYNENPLKINLHSKLMNKSTLKANFTFPMHTNNNTFYFNGSLGSAKFSYFDDIIYPVLGLKIIEGDLDQLTFNAKANEYVSSGTMTMLYHDLNATIFKSKSHKKSKVLSWAVKTILHDSNPVKNKTVRVATLSHSYEPHKGFGNYLWKTLQSGIVNTLSPVGNKTSKKEHKKKSKK